MVFMVILIGAALLPVLAVLLLKSHGAIAFMSLCLGSVLATYISGDVADFVSGFTPLDILSSVEWVKVALLLLPLVLSLLFTARSVRGHKQVLNILPAIATGLLLVIMTMPLLPSDIQSQFEANDILDTINNLQTAIVLAGAFFSLLFLLMTNHSPKHEGKKEK